MREEPPMNTQIKWLFFDVGSTLVDEEGAYEHRLRDIAGSAGVPYALVLETALGFYRQNQRGDLETARHFGVPLPAWHTEDERPYPDAAESLAALHQRYRIGIIANQLPGTRERLEQYGLLSYIDLVVASAEEGVSKPDPQIFRIALDRAGCTPGEAVMIGDRIDNDIVPAKLLGMHTVWIRQGFGGCWRIGRQSEEPTHSVDSLSGLCRLL